MAADHSPEGVTAYLGLGSNLGESAASLLGARALIAGLDSVRESAFSSLYRSAPMGPADQPDYVNAVMAVTTHLAPLALLHKLQAIENEFGRVRTGERWGPRTLDLDILVFGEQIIATAELTVPHPGVGLREFVLYPLCEIAPELNIPGLGRVDQLTRQCPRRGLTRLESR